MSKDADMNQNVIRMFSRIKFKHNVNKKFHLSKMLEELSKGDSPFFTEGATSMRGCISINFAKDDERARKVVKRCNYRMTGKMCSRRNGRMVQWESHYEKGAFQLLETSPYVASYREQPATLKFHNGDGVIQTHFPDIFVELVNGVKIFIEVKPEVAKSDQELLARENLLKGLLAIKGFKYIQIYPDQIKSFHYLENAQHMLWHINDQIPYPMKVKVQDYLSKNIKVRLVSLLNFANNPKAKSWIFGLMVEGVINCDLSKPLSANPLVTSKKQ